MTLRLVVRVHIYTNDDFGVSAYGISANSAGSFV